ncbi:MAG: I78 family peptidase inhibitor [Gemmatimonadales bacterium]
MLSTRGRPRPLRPAGPIRRLRPTRPPTRRGRNADCSKARGPAVGSVPVCRRMRLGALRSILARWVVSGKDPRCRLSSADQTGRVQMNRKCLFAALALIATRISPVAAQPAQPASPMAGCKEEKARFAVGEPYSDELAERARQTSGANVVRKTVPGGADTMELRADRLNLDVDRSGRVQGARCG